MEQEWGAKRWRAEELSNDESGLIPLPVGIRVQLDTRALGMLSFNAPDEPVEGPQMNPSDWAKRLLVNIRWDRRGPSPLVRYAHRLAGF